MKGHYINVLLLLLLLLHGLVDSCVLGVVVYIKSWLICRLPTAAPANDLNLLKLLMQVESPSAKGALKKLCGQLWYLSEELVALTFFDREVDVSVERWWKD